MKSYFRKDAELFKKVCAMELNEADKLIKIQEERKTVLENCGEDVSEKICFDKIHELTLKFVDMYVSIFKESDRIFEEGEESEDLRSAFSE